MFEARIIVDMTELVHLGPTDTRNEAARLARQWLASSAGYLAGDGRPGGRPRLVTRVQIARVSDGDGEVAP